jgi:hypothetical protein
MSLKSLPFRVPATKLKPRRRSRLAAPTPKLVALAGGCLAAVIVATVLARRAGPAPVAPSSAPGAPGAAPDAAKLDLDAPNEGATGDNPSPTDP